MKRRSRVKRREFQKPVVDPVTLSVVWNRLLSITRDVGERVVHSAQSFVMANARDLGPILLDDKGQVITQVDFATAHCLVAEVPTRKILDKFEGKLYSGDCVLANDAHIIKSGHLPDWTFFAPIFWHDELVFYCHFRGHMMDTGGAYSGGYFPRAYDCIAEGLNIPPLKIMERGQECKEVSELIFRNVRNSPDAPGSQKNPGRCVYR
jgi:N-methylhydantoinase B